MFQKISEFCGWLGMVAIHGATVPTMLAQLNGDAVRLPEFSLVFLVWFGLALFLVRAIGRRDFLYIVSNGVGFALNSLLLSMIVFG
jgi:hypothetical protein